MQLLTAALTAVVVCLCSWLRSARERAVAVGGVQSVARCGRCQGLLWLRSSRLHYVVEWQSRRRGWDSCQGKRLVQPFRLWFWLMPPLQSVWTCCKLMLGCWWCQLTLSVYTAFCFEVDIPGLKSINVVVVIMKEYQLSHLLSSIFTIFGVYTVI